MKILSSQLSDLEISKVSTILNVLGATLSSVRKHKVPAADVVSQQHSQAKCPAINCDCSYCKKPGHCLAVCQKRLHNQKFLDVETDPDHVYLPQERVHESDIRRINALHPSSNIAIWAKWAQTVSVLG